MIALPRAGSGVNNLPTYSVIPASSSKKGNTNPSLDQIVKGGGAFNHTGLMVALLPISIGIGTGHHVPNHKIEQWHRTF